MNKLLPLIFCICFAFLVQAQRKCGTEMFNTEIINNGTLIENPEQFENWLNIKKNARQKIQKSQKTTAEVFTVPVVIHIIHYGEAIGEGANLAEDRILKQLKTLNDDFRRLNEDAADTPVDFLPVAIDTEISFELAKQDPEGLPTNGIVRVLGDKPSYSDSELSRLNELSFWPSDLYMNVWVATFSNPVSLGFAQYPVSNIQGIEDLFELNSRTDGIYINYPFFGDQLVEIPDNEDYLSLGRTLTHETGHWLGLRHIWGDASSCSQDDYCSDTPAQSIATTGCPTAGELQSCDEITMFQNYMDYTDDACVNLFTICQTDRMRTVIDFSPRRNTLLASPGLIEPAMVANDLGIRQILTPTFGNCSTTISPEVEVRNYGTNEISGFEIELILDDEPIETRIVSTVLGLQEITTIQFSELMADENTEEFTFKIKSVNGGLDGSSTNDCAWISSFYPKDFVIPLFENFESSDNEIQEIWSLRNMNESTRWSFVTAPGFALDNRAAVLNYFDLPVDMQNGPDFLLSPVFNLLGVVTVDLKFKYAYSYRNNFSTDALVVMISTDCGETFLHENVIFERRGADLSTATSNLNDFIPEGSGDWQSVTLNFGEFANQENVVIAFVGNNGGGNNLYIDDIEISTSNVNNYDIAISEIVSLSPALCRDFVQPLVKVRNLGLQTVDSFNITSILNSQSKTSTAKNLQMLPGKEVIVPIVFSDLTEGTHLLEVEISNPNGEIDENSENNLGKLLTNISFTEESIPLREKFTKSTENSDWSFVRQDDTHNWEIYKGESNEKSAFINGYDVDKLGTLDIKNWMVSPSLDFSNLDSASLQFDLSYGYRIGRNDRLQILGSTNCGTTYSELLYDKSGSNLAINDSNEEWFPTAPEHWRKETLQMSQFAGEEDVKIAFVVTNQNGNNLFIDNIEFFDVGTPPSIDVQGTMSVFPNPATTSFQVIFNFNIKESVTIRLVSLSGEEIAAQVFPNTLNQIYSIKGLTVRKGLYLVHVYGQYTNLTKKIYFNN